MVVLIWIDSCAGVIVEPTNSSLPHDSRHMDMPRERGDKGQYVETVDQRDVLDVLDAVNGPVVTSADIADQLGVSTETGRRKLQSAESDGALSSRKTAGRVVYWRPDRQDGSVTDDMDVFEAWSHGRSEVERAASHAVAERSLVWLREHGGEVQRMNAPIEEWAEADPLDRTADTLWNEVVRSAWSHAIEQGVVEKPHSRAYRWVGGTRE